MTNKDVRSKLTIRSVALVAGLAMLVGGGIATAAPAAPAAPSVPSSSAPLTNLTHLNFLLDKVPLLPVTGHTTYQIDKMSTAQAPWVYADNKDGVFTRVAGGE